MKKVAYICPHCHRVFVSGLKENIFARHTAKARKLTCPGCGKVSFCVEVYREEESC